MRANAFARSYEAQPMYASFFGLRELPFNNTPDPRFFFSTPDHEEALASLIYAIAEGKGFVVLTGEVGAGKTLVTRLMLRHFGTGIAFASVNNSQINANELLHTVCSEFNIDAPANATNVELTRMLQDFLLSSFAMNKPVVLMLDEAQALTREAFEQIRMIGNLEADDAKLLQIVIVGQPELKEMFEANDMRQLRQRIFRSFHLGALTRSQTEGYIFHRLSVAGATYPEKILSASAIDAIFEYSQGLPRLINTLCDNAMLSSYAADTTEIDGAFIKNVIAQMMTVAQGGSKFASPRVKPPATWQPTATSGGALHTQSSAASFVAPAAQAKVDAAEFEQRIQAPISESEMEAVVSSAVGAHATGSADSAQMRRLAVLVRRLLAETRAATDEVRSVVGESRSARQAAEKTLARLSEQTARTGRLTISLRNVFDNLENRARRMSQRSGEPNAAPANKGSDATSRRANSKSFDQALLRNRRSLDEIRSMIESARKGDLSSDTESANKSAPSSDLAKQVRELADMCRSAAIS
ncbi:MAG: AAA family ATPase [Phycisphaerales bacterium]|nr:AAA family ATPase [Phycisphaerales bacterium]